MMIMKTQTYGKTASIIITNKTHLVQAVVQMKRLLLHVFDSVEAAG